MIQLLPDRLFEDPKPSTNIFVIDELQVQLLSPTPKLLARGSELAAGYDLSSVQDVVIPAGDCALVRTDISIVTPAGTYGRIAPRGRLALKHAIGVGAGVVDPDYTGTVGIILFNHGPTDFVIRMGDRIAQLILEQIVTPPLVMVQKLQDTTRGTAGFGSTGVHQETPKEQINSVEPDFNLGHEFYLAQAQDPLLLKFNMTKEGEEISANWAKPKDLWCYWNKIYVPEVLRQTVFRLLHSAPIAGHPGQQATLFTIRKDYYWPNLKADVIEWVRNCDICQRTKVFPKKPHGELKPIDPTPRPWGIVTSDLITGLPPCRGYTGIWTATCKGTKYVHLAEINDTLDSEGLYKIYLDRVWKLHGTQDKLITDRGPQFASRYA